MCKLASACKSANSAGRAIVFRRVRTDCYKGSPSAVMWVEMFLFGLCSAELGFYHHAN